MPTPSKEEFVQKIFAQILEERKGRRYQEGKEVEENIMLDVARGVEDALRDAEDLTQPSHIKWAVEHGQSLHPYQVKAYRQVLDELGIEEHEGKLSRKE